MVVHFRELIARAPTPMLPCIDHQTHYHMMRPVLSANSCRNAMLGAAHKSHGVMHSVMMSQQHSLLTNKTSKPSSLPDFLILLATSP